MLTFFKNKHVVLAMFVAPILAVVAWYVVDHFVAETPHAAVAGGSYPLVAMSNCRYKSGLCTLKNNDVSVSLVAERLDNGRARLSLSTDLEVDAAAVSLVVAGVEQTPVNMRNGGDELSMLSTVLTLDQPADVQLRFAMNVHDVFYYSETGIDFIDYETSFKRENFSQ